MPNPWPHHLTVPVTKRVTAWKAWWTIIPAEPQFRTLHLVCDGEYPYQKSMISKPNVGFRNRYSETSKSHRRTESMNPVKTALRAFLLCENQILPGLQLGLPSKPTVQIREKLKRQMSSVLIHSKEQAECRSQRQPLCSVKSWKRSWASLPHLLDCSIVKSPSLRSHRETVFFHQTLPLTLSLARESSQRAQHPKFKS